MSDNIYLLYKHTSPSGKSYIGITKDYDIRVRGHRQLSSTCRAFKHAINKYGWDNFTHEILAENLTLDEAQELEELCISKYHTMVPNGYNILPGGGVPVGLANKGLAKTEEHIQKIAQSCSTRTQSVETKIKAYMKRHNKTYDEAVEYFKKKEQDPKSVRKYYDKPYTGYASVKEHNARKREQKIRDQMLRYPDDRIGTETL